MTNTALETPLSERTTYYPLTPTEIAVLCKLELSPAALALLMLIKTVAPFGGKVMFTDALNPKSLQHLLKIERTTFWRAKTELLMRQLIEFNDHYIRDRHTVDRANFKQVLPEEPPETKFSALPLSQEVRSLTPVAESQPLLQDCNDRAPEAPQGNASTAPKQIQIDPLLNTYRKTTRHTEPESVSRPFQCEAPRIKIKDEQPSERKPPAPPPPRLEPGEFAAMEPDLKRLGVRFNQNLLQHFYEAGIERVRQAIAYLINKLQATPNAVRRSVTGYLLHLVQHGENLTPEEGGVSKEEEEEDKRINTWYEAADLCGLVAEYRRGSDGQSMIYKSAKYGSHRVPLTEMMAEYPLERLEAMPKKLMPPSAEEIRRSFEALKASGKVATIRS